MINKETLLCYYVVMKRLIFTDLDGTFLNHHNYAFDESFEALKKIKEAGIPLIFTTSKTKSEVELLQEKVGISEPFIVENGAAFFIPENYQGLDLSILNGYEDKKIMLFGQPYSRILNFYRLYKEEYGMLGMSDMSDAKVGELTGLAQGSVFLAKQRDFSEPFIMKDESKLQELTELAKGYELKITKGGRFYHLMGELQDKGIAVIETIELFERLYNEKVYSMALGDSENDLPMLERVDLPIVIQKHDGSYLETGLEKTEKSTYEGSKGWNEMVLKYV
ncbi:MAG: Mannosyl-3-phosphoglycerate phosphatase [uncultured Sulfurovum sp.]|uniref:Mannosyl-3-phosphoglycerate phosphatase n=1 Tax=uncultured Sulfurovum sp. TaxID=269237 RepID=A0A6S6TA82_9BACT|nr:MAG: Mannosyl-3-phosphoglycerate phosphatase [uncultured Sulfurovum sp.]